MTTYLHAHDFDQITKEGLVIRVKKESYWRDPKLKTRPINARRLIKYSRRLNILSISFDILVYPFYTMRQAKKLLRRIKHDVLLLPRRVKKSQKEDSINE